MGWGGGGPFPWGLGPWGGGGAISSVSPAQVPDEGGVEITILGAFVPGRRAVVTLDGANCPYPSALGGVDRGSIPGAGPFPVASSDGSTIKAIVPQLTLGFHDLTVAQPSMPDLTLVGAIEVVRRDFWTRLHSIRQAFPTPPYPPMAVGPKKLELEGRYSQVVADGDPVPALQAQLHTEAAALLEASGTLYTRLVAVPFRSGSVVRVWSTDAGDIGQIVTVHGLGPTGTTQDEDLVLNGVAVVSGVLTWNSVDSAELSLWGAGTITVADDAGTLPERIDIRPGFVSKRAGALQEGDIWLAVDGNWRFPATGELALVGERVTYTAKITDSVCNRFRLAAGVTRPHTLGEMVADASMSQSAVDVGRRMMLPACAEGPYLDAVARRYGGIARPGSISDTLFRAIYEALAYGPIGTMRILELVLDAVVGAGNYELLEEPISFVETMVAGADRRTTFAGVGHPCTVYANWGALLGSGLLGDQGKTYLCGFEPQTSTDATHVTTDHPISVPYGVYAAADVARANNYCDLGPDWPGDGSVGAPGPDVTSGGAHFPIGVVGKPFTISDSARINNGTYRVLARPAAGTVTLEGLPRRYGYVDPSHLDRFRLVPGSPQSSPFGPGCVGKTIRVLDTMAGAPVDRVISGLYLADPTQVVMSAPWPAGCSGATWCFHPALEVDAALDWKAPLPTVAGGQIVLPRALPGALTAVLVDYTSNGSAEVSLDATVAHVPPTLARPFYLSALDTWLLNLLSDLVPAGVRVVAGQP